MTIPRVLVSALATVMVAAGCSGGGSKSTSQTVSFHGATLRVPNSWEVGHGGSCPDRGSVVELAPLAGSPVCAVFAGGPTNWTNQLIVTCATDPTGYPLSTLTTSRLNGEPDLVPAANLADEYASGFFQVPRLNLVIQVSGPAAEAVARTFTASHATPDKTSLAAGCGPA